MKTWVQIPSTQIRGQVWWCASIIIPEPRGWRQEDLWSSLASPNWGASGSLRESISKRKLEREWGRCLSLIAGFHTSVFTHAPTNTCAHVWTCTYMHITDRVLGAFCLQIHLYPAFQVQRIRFWRRGLSCWSLEGLECCGHLDPVYPQKDSEVCLSRLQWCSRMAWLCHRTSGHSSLKPWSVIISNLCMRTSASTMKW